LLNPATEDSPQSLVLRSGTVHGKELLDRHLGHRPSRCAVRFVPNKPASGVGIADQSPAIAIGATIDVRGSGRRLSGGWRRLASTDTHDQGQVEVGLLGREGFVGASVMLSAEPWSVHPAFCQVAGAAYGMSAAAPRSAIEEKPPMVVPHFEFLT